MRGNKSRRAARLPLALVVLALVSAIVVPAVLQIRQSSDREIVTEILRPATARLSEIQIAIALEAVHTRAYMLTSDRGYADAYRVARARRVNAVDRLVDAMRLVGPREYELALRIQAQTREVSSPMDSLYQGLMRPVDYRDRLPVQHERLNRVMATTYELARDVEGRISRYSARIVLLERVGVAATAALVLLALVATLQVARLARDYADLVDRLDLRARRQADLRETAEALNAGVTEAEAAEALAKGAVRSLGALGAYVERAHTPEPGSEVEVIGVEGEGTPPLGTKVPYPGSLTEALTASREPYLLHEVSAVGDPTAPYLIERCRGCKGLVAPITFGGEAVGALVLLRSAEEEQFSRDEAAYAAVLADFASTTFRRVALVEELRESEERFRQIADHVGESIWLSDPGFHELHYANPAYERLWGRGPDGRLLLLRDRLNAVHPDDREAVEQALRGLPQGEYEIEYRLVRPDGQLRWVRSRGYPIRNERGEVYRVAGITEDITDRKRAEHEREELLRRAEEARAEAERRRDELQRVTESRSRLMRGFGHDVKNPLGAADGFLQLMEEGVVGELTEKQRESVASARRSIGAALDLIDQLLDLARAEAGGIELQSEPTDLRALLKDAAGEYRAQAESQGLDLTTEVAGDVPIVESDGSRIRQIIGNLLSNAVKFTERGSVTVRAETREGVAAPGPGRWVAIDVADTGPGISPEQQRRLFKEFSRVEETGKEGSGIGLAISRRLARALGGELTVQSEAGKGSTFTLWLPADAAVQESDASRQAAD